MMQTKGRPAVNWLLEYCDNLSPDDRCIEIMDREKAIELIHKIQDDAYEAGRREGFQECQDAIGVF